ncbi:MAG: GNAT family N-acetyltransferase [Firmicutes bacterium]|nr:GNAT family N-acetyltransferase [Bacillota bacterium]
MIRRFEQSDLEPCAKIFMSVYNNEIWQNFWSFEKAKEYLKDITEFKKFIGFTLLVDNSIKGAILGREKTWWNNNEIFIEEMFVSPELQRQGYGTALLNAVECYIKEKGLAGFTLLTNRYTPAPNFYRKNGFCDGEHVLFMYKVV